jgi:membrane-bound metal-dependent hydrolase YbcI (DUF457 family)
LPSPIVHSTAGYVVYRFSKGNMPEVWQKRVGPVSLFLLLTLVFSNLPDLDAVPGFILGDFGKFHNNGTHSLIVALLVALIFGFALSRKRRGEFISWFLLILISYGTHILLDFFTWGGRGVMLFWPFSTERFQSGLALFYGVRWADGLLSINHLWTLGTEVVFVLILLLFTYLAEHRTLRVTKQENV